MDMRVIGYKKCLCTCCMEEHEVKIVAVPERMVFKNAEVSFEATYFFCDAAEELYADEVFMRKNDRAMKEAYRQRERLLTVGQIMEIRGKYGISQSDLCTLLGWGGKTIARYETHQVQDRAHNSILKKVAEDPQWFLTLLEEAKESLSEEAYRKYYLTATSLFEEQQDLYLRKAIEALYARFQGSEGDTGNANLSLDKVVDVIRYFASSEDVTGLYKVKLMKLLWYADALSYKSRGHAITGLVYQALPMGAVPVGHDSIIDLKGVPCTEVDMGETTAYHFSLEVAQSFPFLSKEETEILDTVIGHFGKMSKNELVEFMHRERAFTETPQRSVIRFEYAKELQI